MSKIKKFIKAHKYASSALAVLVLGLPIFFLRGSDEAVADTVTAMRTNVVEETSVTGRVVPAHEVDLAIQSGGRVAAINAAVGQRVSAGQTLLRVDSSDLSVKLGRQEAALEKAKLAYSQEMPGESNARADLDKAYDDGFNAVADAFLDMPSVIAGLDDVFNTDSLSDESIRNSYGNHARDERRSAQAVFYDAEDKYKDVLKEYKAATRGSDRQSIEALIMNTYEAAKLMADAVKSTNNFVDYIDSRADNASVSAELDGVESTLHTYTEEMGGHLTDILAAKNVIDQSQDDIASEASDTKSSSISIRQAELDIQDTRIQIAERSIRSPISGIVTDIGTEVGETISQGTPVISIISDSRFEIEANIPEADMPKVKVGADTEVILDAYGSDVVFKAKVVSINPAETLLDGVATYKTKLQFTDDDERIRSGMTASLTIAGQSAENVIAVPQRSVITRDGKKYVQVVEGEEVVDKPVTTGLRGSDGNIEIVSGIEEGEKVVVYSESK